MASNNGSKTGKLAKLTELEEEVAKLSEQLKVNKKTIGLLKKTIAERDLKIHELESKLTFAQQSLLKKATFTIHQCREQVKSGLDEKIITPALTQIQQQIDVIQGIVGEAKDFISKKKLLIHDNINTTSNLVQQCPDQAIRYFEKWIVEPSRLLVNEAAGIIDSNVKTGQDLVVQKVIYPGKAWSDRIVVFVLALPSRSQVIFQVWLDEPVVHKFEALPIFGKGLRVNVDVWLMDIVGQLKSVMEQGLANTVDAIKSSPFWDGKRNMEAL